MSASLAPEVPAATTSPGTTRPTQFRKLLVALDRRHRDPTVAAPVWQLVRSLAAEVTFCYVEMRSTIAAGNEMDGAPANAEETGILRDLRAATVAALGAPGRDLPIKILHGDPGQRICEYAEFLGADLIVLGPREKASIAKAFRGSVSKYVVGNSRTSVLVLGS